MPISEKGLKITQRSLLKALSAEQQAIAIYSAEIALLKLLGRSEEVFSQTLSEEREHEGHITRYLREHSLEQAGAFSVLANQVAGATLGTFLALLPRQLRNRAHVWAENEAARIYYSCADTVTRWQSVVPRSNELIQALRHSGDQEKTHALRFSRAD